MRYANKEIVDKSKILDIARDIASEKGNYFDRLEEGMYGLSLEEQNLVLGFTYTILLAKQFRMPKEIVEGQMSKINSKVQKMARDNQRYCEYSKRQIELIKPTDELRADFSKQINSGQFDDALTTACKLIDIYEFGIAGSQINYGLLEKAREKYNVQVD
ncbi:MAG: hypothetical protein J1E81_07550 [Eubacterium sp.]|nr:hypothetical protein [Eubacterium sp.]